MPAIIRQIPTSAMGIVGKGCSGAEALESAFTPPATDDAAATVRLFPPREEPLRRTRPVVGP